MIALAPSIDILDTFPRLEVRMVNVIRHYLRLLKVELLDLMEDIDLVKDRLETRYSCNEITPYVKMENEAILTRESGAIDRILAIVDEIDPSIYKSIAEFESAAMATFRERLEPLEEPEAVFKLLERKMAKIRAFIESGDTDARTR